jgi:hypothetical protein
MRFDGDQSGSAAVRGREMTASLPAQYDGQNEELS